MALILVIKRSMSLSTTIIVEISQRNPITVKLHHNENSPRETPRGPSPHQAEDLHVHLKAGGDVPSEKERARMRRGETQHRGRADTQTRQILSDPVYTCLRLYPSLPLWHSALYLILVFLVLQSRSEFVFVLVYGSQSYYLQTICTRLMFMATRLIQCELYFIRPDLQFVL